MPPRCPSLRLDSGAGHTQAFWDRLSPCGPQGVEQNRLAGIRVNRMILRHHCHMKLTCCLGACLSVVLSNCWRKKITQSRCFVMDPLVANSFLENQCEVQGSRSLFFAGSVRQDLVAKKQQCFEVKINNNLQQCFIFFRFVNISQRNLQR